MCKRLLILLLVFPWSLVVISAAGAQEVSLNQLRPQWTVGDRWTVETSTRPIQARTKLRQANTQLRTVRWEFSVQALEKLGERDAYRIVVRLDGGVAGPAATLWVERGSLSLQRIQVRMPRANGFHTITESYRVTNGQASPIIGPLTALPLDMPVFVDGDKSVRVFQYEAIAGSAEAKAIGDVGFTLSVQQQETAVQSKDAKQLLHREFAKNILGGPSVAVDLTSHGRRVRQLWQPEMPWPVFSLSGPTEARLVRVVRANAVKDSKEQKND